MMNQIFECPANIRIASCSCPNGMADAPIPGVCLDRANNHAVYGKNCECSDGSDSTIRSNA